VTGDTAWVDGQVWAVRDDLVLAVEAGARDSWLWMGHRLRAGVRAAWNEVVLGGGWSGEEKAVTTERLEELVRKCAYVLQSDTPDIASVIELADIADLSRCARALAKLERIREGTFFNNVNDLTNADTAIEAVEAAEVSA